MESIAQERDTHFEFEPRPTCICGEPLEKAAATVTKRFPRGSVTFLRCGACGSWCQSPMITEAALASWIDSEQYQGSDRTRGVAYDNYTLDEHNRIAEARTRYARDLAQLLRPGSRVLEIGWPWARRAIPPARRLPGTHPRAAGARRLLDVHGPSAAEPAQAPAAWAS